MNHLLQQRKSFNSLISPLSHSLTLSLSLSLSLSRARALHPLLARALCPPSPAADARNAKKKGGAHTDERSINWCWWCGGNRAHALVRGRYCCTGCFGWWLAGPLPACVFVCLCMCVCVCMYVLFMYVCMYVCKYVYVYVYNADRHAGAQTQTTCVYILYIRRMYLFMCAGTYMYLRLCMYVYVCTRSCILGYVCMYVYTCVHTCYGWTPRALRPIYTHTYVRTYIHTYMHACIHTYVSN